MATIGPINRYVLNHRDFQRLKSKAAAIGVSEALIAKFSGNWSNERSMIDIMNAFDYLAWGNFTYAADARYIDVVMQEKYCPAVRAYAFLILSQAGFTPKNKPFLYQKIIEAQTDCCGLAQSLALFATAGLNEIDHAQLLNFILESHMHLGLIGTTVQAYIALQKAGLGIERNRALYENINKISIVTNSHSVEVAEEYIALHKAGISYESNPGVYDELVRKMEHDNYLPIFNQFRQVHGPDVSVDGLVIKSFMKKILAEKSTATEPKGAVSATTSELVHEVAAPLPSASKCR